MKLLFYYTWFAALILTTTCKKKRNSIPFELYYKMDIDRGANKKLNPRTTATIPFNHNQIFDPFLSSKDHRNSKKANFSKGSFHKLQVHVLDSIHTKMNIQVRKEKKEKYIQAFPVIIENTASLKSMNLPLHRGCALIIQQMKTKNNKWIDIENRTKEKLGDFYYKIKPKQYIYTKTPIYSGKDSVEIRIKLVLGDTAIYSNTYKSTVPNWIKRKE